MTTNSKTTPSWCIGLIRFAEACGWLSDIRAEVVDAWIASFKVGRRAHRNAIDAQKVEEVSISDHVEQAQQHAVDITHRWRQAIAPATDPLFIEPRQQPARSYKMQLSPEFQNLAEGSHLSSGQNLSLILLLLRLYHMADKFPLIDGTTDLRVIDTPAVLFLDGTELAPLSVVYKIESQSDSVIVVDVRPLKADSALIASVEQQEFMYNLLRSLQAADLSVQQLVKLLVA